MNITFSDDMRYVYIKDDDGKITGIPFDQLTDDDVEFIINEKAKQGYF